MKPVEVVIIVLLMLLPVQGDGGAFQYKKWFVSEPVLQAGPPGTFDDVAVKDPTIVRYNGKYHMFYTSKASKAASGNYKHLSIGRAAVAYAASETLEGFKNIGATTRQIAKICQGKEIDLLCSGYNPNILPSAWLAIISGLANVEVDLEEPLAFGVEKNRTFKEVNNVVTEVKRNLRQYWKSMN